MGGARRRPRQNSQRVLPTMARARRRGRGCAEVFNTKGHKERRDGMDRNTKAGTPGSRFGVDGAGDGAQRARARARNAKPRTAPCGAAARWGHRALPRRDRTANGPRNGTRMVRRGRKWRCVTRVRNGGRARCPHRAARVMRGCNGGRVQWCGGAGAARMATQWGAVRIPRG